MSKPITFFPFGAQYLRGATPARADWERDLAACRAHGMNTVRAWLVWGVLEPEPGRIDTDYLDAFLAAAHKSDLAVGLLFHLHGCPEWTSRTHRHCFYVDCHGRPFEPAPRPNTPSGGWPGLCPDHPETQALEERFMSAVLRHVGDHPAVAFWEPINEPHQWIEWTTTPPEPFCFCEPTRAAFRAWLRDKYESLGSLETAWGRRFSSWDDVRPPTWRYNLADAIDFRAFTIDSVRGLIRRRTAIIRRHVKTPVSVHAWGGGSTTCVNLGGLAFDDWRNAAEVDWFGVSSFPMQPDHLLSVGLGTVATRCAAQGKPFWQAELGTGDYGSTMQRRGRMPPAIEVGFCWESIRQGAQGLLFWQYRKEAHGPEMGAFGLTDYAGGPTDVLRAVTKVGSALDRHRDLFRAAKPAPAEVAIAFSLRTHLAEWAASRTSQMCVDSITGWFRAFWDASIPADIVHEELVTAGELDRYRVVVLPNPVCLHPRLRALLAGYVERGGHLLSDPYLCAFTPEGHLTSTAVPGDGLDALFGCRERDITSSRGRTDELTWNGRKLAVAGGHFREDLELCSGGEAVATFADGSPAIVARRHGRGRAVFAGISLGLSTCAGGGAAEIVLALAREAGVTAPLGCNASLRSSLLHAGPNEAILFVLNVTEQSVASTVELGEAFDDALDVVSDTAMALDGKRIALTLQPHATMVVRLRRAGHLVV